MNQSLSFPVGFVLTSLAFGCDSGIASLEKNLVAEIDSHSRLPDLLKAFESLVYNELEIRPLS
jgi:hypothetical protein